MAQPPRLMAFLATAAPERARGFYDGLLGLRLVAEDGFAIVFNSSGIMLRVQKVQEHRPQPQTALGWSVDSIAGALAELESRGVGLERFGFLEQDERGVWTAPSGDRVAWFRDPDGNLLSVTELRPA